MPTPCPAPRDSWQPAPAVRASVWLHALAVPALAAAPAYWPAVLGAIAADHLVLGAAGLWPRSPLLGPNLSRLPPAAAARGVVALTFDDGPDPEVTPAVLDLLEARGARASFFCIGKRAAAHPGLAREIVRRGHSVENHTHTHPALFACRGPAALAREIARAQAVITEICGEAPRFFRAPMGFRSPLLDPVLARAGLVYASWTRRGFDTAEREPGTVLRRLTRGLAGGDVLLLHDGNSARARDGRPVVLEVLPALLGRMEAVGLRGVSLPVGFIQNCCGAAGSPHPPIASQWVPPSPAHAGEGKVPFVPLARLREREGPNAKRWEGEG